MTALSKSLLVRLRFGKELEESILPNYYTDKLIRHTINSQAWHNGLYETCVLRDWSPIRQIIHEIIRYQKYHTEIQNLAYWTL